MIGNEKRRLAPRGAGRRFFCLRYDTNTSSKTKGGNKVESREEMIRAIAQALRDAPDTVLVFVWHVVVTDEDDR